MPTFGVTVNEVRVARSGNLIAGGGVTTDIDMTLTIVADIAGVRHAQVVQPGTEYALVPSSDYGRPERVVPEVLAMVTSRLDHLHADRHGAVQRATQHL